MHSTDRRQFAGYMFSAIALGGLASCGGQTVVEPEAKTVSRAQIRLAVNRIEIVDNSTIGQDMSFIDRRRVDEMRGTATDYLKNRFLAAGGDSLARASFEEIRMIERPLETSDGLAGLLKAEAGAELDAALTVRMAILDVIGLERGFAQARVSRTRKFDKLLTVVERDAAAKMLMADLVDRLDQSLSDAVEQHLAEFVTF